MSTPSVNDAQAGRIGRPATDLLWVIGGFALLLLSALSVHQHSISAFETSVFRALNDWTVLPFVVIWPVMQLGNFLVIPITAAIAAVPVPSNSPAARPRKSQSSARRYASSSSLKSSSFDTVLFVTSANSRT